MVVAGEIDEEEEDEEEEDLLILVLVVVTAGALCRKHICKAGFIAKCAKPTRSPTSLLLSAVEAATSSAFTLCASRSIIK